MATHKDREFLEQNDRHPTVDEVFNEGYQKAGLQPQGLIKDAEAKEAERAAFIKDTEEQLAHQARIEYRNQLQTQNDRAQVKKRPDSRALGGTGVGVMNRRSIFFAVFVHSWIYFTVQLPLVLVSLAFLGIATGIQSTWLGRAVGSAASAANRVTSFVGFDFSFLSPENIFLALHLFLYGILLLVLIFTVGYYSILRRERALSGTGTEAKYGTILLCLMGYAIPLANLFPWIGLYVFVMWRYPK